MNRAALLAPLPNNDAFNGMTPQQRKGVVEDFINSIFDALEEDNRDPDAWEADMLSQALGRLAAGWYNAALTVAEKSLTPPDQRAPGQPAAQDPIADLDHWRDALAQIRGIPARNN
jgi:hypothetical protein